MLASSSSVKSRCSRAVTFCSSWATLLAPISTEVTRWSRKAQAMAIWATSRGVGGAIGAPTREGGSVDRAAAEQWIQAHVTPSGAIETAHERPWSTVLRVPLPDGAAWFKACSAVQAFEPRLTAQLFARWPDRVPEVLAYDDERGWLLLADAGAQLAACGNPPGSWLAVLPRYAELQ